jgi:hypothetical protein
LAGGVEMASPAFCWRLRPVRVWVRPDLAGLQPLEAIQGRAKFARLTN